MDANHALKEQLDALYTFIVLEPGNAEAEGFEPTDWERQFTEDVWRRFDAGRSLSDKQVEKVEELFERYFG